MYKTISNPAWHVYWCYPEQWPWGGCLASSNYPPQYIANDYDGSDVVFTAYTVIRAFRFLYPDFTVLQRLSRTYGVGSSDFSLKVAALE